jgi:hypothetical protein
MPPRPAIGRPHSLQVPKFLGPPKDSPEPGLPGPGPNAVDEQPETGYQSSQIHASHPAPQAIRSSRDPQKNRYRRATVGVDIGYGGSK